MIILVDVDGVVANLADEWIKRYNADWDDNLTKEKIKTWGIVEHIKPECGNRIYEYI